MENKKDKKTISVDAMERLAKVMNDTPTIVKMGNTEFAITHLKPGTQWLIAEESCKIMKAEQGNFKDVIKQFAINIPSVVHVITLAILNDKNRIFEDYKSRKYSEEYQSVYETIMWVSMDYFFQSTNAVAMIREAALGRKMKMEELKS